MNAIGINPLLKGTDKLSNSLKLNEPNMINYGNVFQPAEFLTRYRFHPVLKTGLQNNY